MDQKNRNHAILLYGKKNLCKECAGTGNEFYSCYRKCASCDGLGVNPEKLKELCKKLAVGRE